MSAAPLAALLCATVTGVALAHEVLRSSRPAKDDRLDAVPAELVLTFGEPVELGLTKIELLTAAGDSVELSPLALGESGNVVVATVVGPLTAPGEYTVAWSTAGPDGHPARGRFDFTILEGAAGLASAEPPAPTGVEADADARTAGPKVGPAEAAVQAPTPAAEFDAESPVYVAIRWFTFLCLVGLLGTVSFRLLVLPLASREPQDAVGALVGMAAVRARTIGLALAVVLVPATLARLGAQAYALGGVNAQVIGSLLGGSTWGWGWLLQAAATVAVLVGFVWAGRMANGGVGWAIAALGTVLLAFTPALSGHAIATATLTPVAVAADAVHVIGAGGWLGSLALVLAAGIPAARGLAEERRGAAVAALVNAFSPTALAFAGALVTTGVYASWLHVGRVDALLHTAYGRTLLVKLGALSLVFATGAYNFLRVRPSLGTDGGTARIRRSSIVELTMGVVVLVVTAVLVATPPAVDAPHDAGVAHAAAAPG